MQTGGRQARTGWAAGTGAPPPRSRGLAGALGVATDLRERAAHISPEPPAALAAMPIDELRQSPAFQARIDALEADGARRWGWLAPHPAPPPLGRILIVTAMKDEAPFILDWVAYYLALGVWHILVYTNDCSDNTNEILDRLQALGHVTRLPNPWRPGDKKKPQQSALHDAMTQPVMAEADWVLTIDVDEYLNIHVGEGSFADLMTATNHPNVISFTWKFFGYGGVVAYRDEPVIAQFLRCAPEYLPNSRLGWGFKSMFRTDLGFGRLGVHRPLDPDPDRIDALRWVNGSGRLMPPWTATGDAWASTHRTVGYKLATLNHYVLRSAESFLVKRARGRINHVDQDQGQEYWRRRNFGSERDSRILARLPAALAWRSRLLADPALAAAHAEAVAWHAGRIATLKAEGDYAQLFAAISAPDQTDAVDLVKAGARTVAPADIAGRLGAKPAELAARGGAPAPVPGAPPAMFDQPVAPRFQPLAAYAAAAGGFFWQGATTALCYLPGGADLVVGFDNMEEARTGDPRLPAFGPLAVGGLGASVLGVMKTARDWYRDGAAAAGLQALAAAGFFDRFGRVLFAGSCMGGFGALALSPIVPRSHVLAFSPQTTLDPRRFADPVRWGWAGRLDWDGPFADGADRRGHHGPVTVILDPHEALDRAQAARLAGPGIRRLSAPCLGRQLPLRLEELGVLEDVFQAVLSEDGLDQRQLSDWVRGRRDLAIYQDALLARLAGRGRHRWVVFCAKRFLQTRKAKPLRELLRGARAALRAARNDAAA